MQASRVFLPMMIARFRSGAETGSVRESADEMADLYENETRMKLEMVVESIKLGVAFFISFIVGLLTVLSMETAFMMPSGSEIMINAR
jgi:type IV pilus assembly protein PilC